MFEVAEQALARRAARALQRARTRRELFAHFRIAIGDPSWEILLGLTQLGAVEQGAAFADLSDVVQLPELELRRHLASLCEAELAWMSGQDDTRAGIAPAGLARVRKALMRR